MKTIVSMLAICAILCLTAVRTLADDTDTKEVTLKGTALCAKCELKQTEKCQPALKVTEDGKDVIYYITMDDKGKALHHEICKESKDGVSVTGVVSEKDGQKWITASKIE